MPFGECEVRGDFCKSRDFEIGTSDGKPNEKLSVKEKNVYIGIPYC